ncbi:hypothetical protein THAOC_05823, partial [Thalassiosira oceanica]
PDCRSGPAIESAGDMSWPAAADADGAGGASPPPWPLPREAAAGAARAERARRPYSRGDFPFPPGHDGGECNAVISGRASASNVVSRSNQVCRPFFSVFSLPVSVRPSSCGAYSFPVKGRKGPSTAKPSARGSRKARKESTYRKFDSGLRQKVPFVGKTATRAAADHDSVVRPIDGVSESDEK